MLCTVVDLLDFALILSFSAAITICVLFYLGRRSRSAILICGYFITQMILELLVRVEEVQSPLARWCAENLYTAAGVKGLAYSVMMVMLLMSLLSLLELPDRPIYFVPVGAVCVWLLCLTFLLDSSPLMYWAYLLPYELLYLGMFLAGLSRLRRLKQEGRQRSFHPLLGRVLVAGVVFACAILAEDTLTSWFYGFFTAGGGTSHQGLAYLKERNYSESLFQLVLCWAAISAGLREAAAALGAEKPAVETRRSGTPATEAVPAPGPSAPPAAPEAYAEAIGLSPRERQIYRLLLDNKSVQEIAQTLYISPGTVKSHAHNIYQKAQVGDRKELIQKAQAFEG